MLQIQPSSHEKPNECRFTLLKVASHSDTTVHKVREDLDSTGKSSCKLLLKLQMGFYTDSKLLPNLPRHHCYRGDLLIIVNQ